MIRLLVFALSCPALLTACNTNASVEDKQFCATFARNAVDQYNKAAKFPACKKYIDQNRLRWQPVYENHYGGCLSLGATLSQNEQSIREGQLLDCAR